MTPADPTPTPGAEAVAELVARAIYEDRNKSLANCWSWDDSGLDDEHPGARERYLRIARAAIAAMQPALTTAIAVAVAGEREACAEAMDARAANARRIVDRWVPGPDGNNQTIHHWMAREKEATEAAAAIRARSPERERR